MGDFLKEKVLDKLFSNQDLKYKEFHSSLVPNISNFIGVRIPDIKKIAYELNENEIINYLNLDSYTYYEEKMIYAFCLSKIKDYKTFIYYLEKFIPMIDNWAVCDSALASFKIINKRKEEFFDYISKYKNSNKEFELRFLVVCLLNYYLNSNYLNNVVDIINNIDVDYYYVNMAIAWLISIMFIKDRTFTLNYLRNNNLKKFIYNKSIQKILESKRVAIQDKNVLKGMKRL